MTTPLRTFIMNLPQGPIRMTGNYSSPLLAGMGEGLILGLMAVFNDTRDPLLREQIMYSNYDVEPNVKEINDYDITDKLTDRQRIDRWYLSRTYTGRYILILKDYLYSATVFRFVNELELREFLQGLLSILNAFNVDPKTIIMYAPFRNDDDYSIDGLTLPKLE